MDASRISALFVELDQARMQALNVQPEGEFRHLERAHVLAQPNAWYHSIVHFRMLGWAIRNRDLKELLGQLFRLVVAAPASAIGKFPIGNTGGSRVSAFLPMDPPEDLRKFFVDSDR